ncbi:MAG: hypothetical protein ACFFBD_02075 [Candidatus Hodarchaeota archaeon]
MPFRDLRKTCQQNPKEDHKLSFWNISIYLSWIFIKLKIHPDYVTYLGIFAGIISAIFFSTGIWECQIIGSFLYLLWQILDCCDGEVARFYSRTGVYDLDYKQKKALSGDFIESIQHSIVDSLVFAGIGIGIYITNPTFIYLLAAIFSPLFSTFLRDVHKARKIAMYESNVPIDKTEENNRRKTLLNFRLIIYKIHVDSGILWIIISIAAFFRLLNFLIVFYTFSSFFLILTSIHLSRGRALKYGRI